MRIGFVDVDIVSKNRTWKVEIHDDNFMLINKTGELKKKVVELIAILDKRSNYEWDVIDYKGLIAFKNPCERKTYIYDRQYFLMRFHAGDILKGEIKVIEVK